jgi:predicted dithiol-disulfide oxidoreductase (DUF899 family)
MDDLATGPVPDNALPPVVSAQEWEKAYGELLVEEKALTRARDALAAKRRRMPMTAVIKDYRFVGPDGEAGLAELFAGRAQLILYRFFFEDDVDGWPDKGCGGCSFLASHVADLRHINARDTTFAMTSPASQQQITQLAGRMGWSHIPWYTMLGKGTDVDFAADHGVDQYFGLNVFLRDGDQVYRTYFVNARGGEALTPTWAMLDLTPFGRQENWEDTPPGRPQERPYGWWGRPDEYGPRRAAP